MPETDFAQTSLFYVEQTNSGSAAEPPYEGSEWFQYTSLMLS